MTMSPGIRKLTLTAHVVASVGWLGAVAGFLALALTGLGSEDTQRVTACYVAMELLGWLVIVPLSVASLLTGLIQAFGTSWGLFRHYWVLIKLVITVLATILLLVHMQPTSQLAQAAARGVLGSAELRGLRTQLVADAAAALLALLIATVLSIYKPRGVTPYGWRRQQQERGSSTG